MRKPTSFRFNESLINRLRLRAETKKKSLSEYAEEILNSSLNYDDFELNHYHRMIENPEKHASKIYEKLKDSDNNRISLSELMFIFHYCREAYINHSGFISGCYINIFARMSAELIKYSLENHIDFDKHYVYRCFDLNDRNLESKIIEIDNNSKKIHTSSYAEYILRPLESGAFDLSKYPNEVINDIFSKEKIREVFPLIIYGLKKSKASQPKEINFELNNEKITFEHLEHQFSILCLGNEYERTKQPQLFLSITTKNSNITFSCETLLKLIRELSISEHETLYTPSCSVIHPTKDNKIGIINIDNFRLEYYDNDFYAFKVKIKEAIDNEEIAPIIQKMRVMYGDI